MQKASLPLGQEKCDALDLVKDRIYCSPNVLLSINDVLFKVVRDSQNEHGWQRYHSNI